MARAPQMHALVGVAGVGKTQLAAEYAHGVRTEREVIWWVRTEHVTSLTEDLLGLAAALMLPTAVGADASARLQSLRQWLETTAVNWLLIFDNAETPQILLDHLPAAGRGQVLITSQNPDWSRVAKVVPVTPLTNPASTRFLAKRAESRQKTDAAAVAELLGGLCLALEHAGAFIRESGLPLSEFVDLLDREGFSAADGPVLGHPEPLAAVWGAEFSLLAERNDLAIIVLELLSLVDPDEVPRELIVQSVPSKSALAINDAIRALRGFSLVDVQQQRFSVHRLLTMYVRERSVDQRAAHIASLVHTLDNLLVASPEDPDGWGTYGSLVPHVRAVAGHADIAQLSGKTVRALAAVLTKVGRYLNARAFHDAAKECLLDAIGMCQSTDRADAAVLMDALVALARTERNLGAYKPAIDHLNDAERLCDSETEPNRRSAMLTVFGRVLHDLGRLKDARGKLEESVELRERPSAVKSELTVSMNYLSRVLIDLKNYKDAEALLKCALHSDEAIWGLGHPRTAWTLDNFGTALLALGEVVEARRAYVQALGIEEDVNGAQHPRTAWTLGNLATLEWQDGNLARARELLHRAVQIETVAYGADNPRTLLTACKLESLQQQLDEESAAVS